MNLKMLNTCLWTLRQYDHENPAKCSKEIPAFHTFTVLRTVVGGEYLFPYGIIQICRRSESGEQLMSFSGLFRSLDKTSSTLMLIILRLWDFNRIYYRPMI